MLSYVKNIRSELGRDFKELEEKRKLVKETVMKSYNDFSERYKLKISNLFSDADKKLKTKIDEVEDEILSCKIEGLRDYFNLNNRHDFIKFDDVSLRIIKSKSDKAYETEINEYLKKRRLNFATKRV
jgi:L-lactate utilization protein LutB